MSSQGTEHSGTDTRTLIPERGVKEVRPKSREHCSKTLSHENSVISQSQETRKTYPTSLRDVELECLAEMLERANKRLTETLPWVPFSDWAVKTQYDDLCDMVQDWVDTNCGDAASLYEEHPTGIEVSSTQKRLIDDLLDNGSTMKIDDVGPDADSYLPMRIVMRFLFERLLRRTRWHPGVRLDQEELLTITLRHLYDAYPTRGSVRRESWRCHTYRSFRNSPEIQARGQRQLEEFSEELFNVISVFVRPNHAANKKSVEGIIFVAAVLADMIRSCPVQYVFVYAFAPQMPVASRALKKKTAGYNVVIDIGTGVSMREATTYDDIETENIQGEVLGTVFPSLFKLNVNGTVINIARGMVLARRSTNIVQKGQTQGQASQTSGEATKTASEECTVKPARQWSSLLK